jgi:ribosomal protein S12 methylthiotransferase
VEGAAANALPGQVPEDVKQERLERFMETQAEISAARLERRIGQEMTVLVDEITDDGTALARSYADAPEIDGVVIIENSAGLEVGEFARVRITDAGDHDLWAERV